MRLLPLLLLSTPILANSETEDMVNTALKLGGSMVLIIVLIFILAWIVKRVQPGHQGIKGNISVIASTQVSPQARICLVKIKKHCLLLGVTNTQVNLLQPFDASDFEDITPPPDELRKKFSSLLSKNKDNPKE